MEGGGSKRGGGVFLPQEKTNQSFKFECLKWPILAAMTAKSGIYFHFLSQQGGGGGAITICVAERGGGGTSGNPAFGAGTDLRRQNPSKDVLRAERVKFNKV